MKTDPEAQVFSEQKYVGLTKREYFAIHAPVDRAWTIAGKAEDAVKYADALIKELNKVKDEKKK